MSALDNKKCSYVKKNKKIFILSDDIYEHITYDNFKFSTIAEINDLKHRTLTMNGVSKSYSMTGWRLGWSVWPEKLVEHVIKFCVNNHSCVNAAIQYGAIAQDFKFLINQVH